MRKFLRYSPVKVIGKSYWLLALFLFFLHFAGLSQVQVTGKVVSEEDNEGLPGVAILVQGTNQGTVTDISGNYTISVDDPNAVLEFSFIGFRTEVVRVGGRSTIDVKLGIDIQSLQEIVVIGYGEQTKREVTGAIAQIKSEEINKLGTFDFGTAIQGQLAGVSVRAASGAPGENAIINIRGVSSFLEGQSEPLYVVDGIPFNTNPNITPQEIESIEVLKDGASAAIYGTRASAGVILITTKKGQPGQVSVTLDSYYGIQNIISDIDLVNTSEALFVNDLENRFNTTNKAYILPNNPDALLHDTDWMDELQVNNAPMQNHNLTVAGGKENLTFSLVGNFFSQDGSLINSDYQKESLRANTAFEEGKFRVQTTLAVDHDLRTNAPWGMMYRAIQNAPFLPGINPDEETAAITGTNPDVLGGFVNLLREESTNESNGFQGNIRLTYELLEGLTLGAHLGGNVRNQTNRLFQPSFRVFDGEGQFIPIASNLNPAISFRDIERIRTIQEYTINYTREFGRHKVTVLAGNTYETIENDDRFVRAQGITSDDTPTLSNGSDPRVTQTLARNTLIGFVGRVLYSFNSKYNISASIRRDGSSRFGPGNRWGTFPAISAAWNISDEPFFQGIKNVVSDFKIRYGYALTGSDRIPNYAFAPQVLAHTDYIFGDDLSRGLSQVGFADPNIKWETNVSNNLGFELQFLQGKANLTVDLYRNSKEDMLQSVRTAPSDGAFGNNDRVIRNIGNMVNEGIEIAAGYNLMIGEVGLNLAATFTRNVNEVTSLADGQTIIEGRPNLLRGGTDPVSALREGLPAGALFLIPTAGVIKTQEELDAYQQIDPNAQLGDLRYTDVNGDRQINDDDRVYSGSTVADFEYGFNINANYRGFDLTLQFFGVQGIEVYNGPRYFAFTTKRHRDLVYAWSPENADSNIPTPRTGIEHPNVRAYSDYFVEDGSFLRVRNIIVGYTLPTSFVTKYGLKNLRIYASAQNPITWTGYTGFDPEVASGNIYQSAIDLGKYPLAATYRMGLTLGL
ncbi:MAG: TonB-dependent receptor [Cytophagales bacterium]|nr:TonB-dependent receptor [Cytophagales bacterium]